MSSFCRHNRLVERCPICSRRDKPKTTAAQKVAASPASGQRRAGATHGTATRTRQRRQASDLLVRRAARAPDDGFRNILVMGIHSSEDARKLARELAFATGRLEELENDPPDLYAELVSETDPEEAAWLNFLVAYISPLESEDPFREIRRVRTTWASGELPDLSDVGTGPRTAHDENRGTATLEAYRHFAQRAGSQQAALSGEPHWSPQRRFDRIFERLAFPGMHRAARFDVLVTLGWLGLYDMRGDRLHVGIADETTVAAKRVFGIGDTFHLERRAAELSKACEIPFGALDLALYNWAREGRRVTLGARGDVADDAVRERVEGVLGV